MALGVVELAVLAQHQPMIRCIFNHLRRPHNTAARIVAAQYGHDHSIISSDILEATENACRNVEDVAFFQNHLACIAPTAPKKPPATREHKECLCCAVVMKRVTAFGRLARGANIEAVRDCDVDVLVRAFGHAAADNGEVFLLVAARRMGVDKGGLAGLQFAIADDAGFHFLWGHLCGSGGALRSLSGAHRKRRTTARE